MINLQVLDTVIPMRTLQLYSWLEVLRVITGQQVQIYVQQHSNKRRMIIEVKMVVECHLVHIVPVIDQITETLIADTLPMIVVVVVAVWATVMDIPVLIGSMILNMVHPEEEKVHTQVALIITAAAEEIMTVEEVTMVLASEDQEIDMVMEIHGNMVVVVENSTIEGTMKTDLTTIIIWMIEDITMVAEVILAKAECMEVIYPNVVVDVVVIDSLDLGSILEQEEKKMIINAMKEEWEGVINVVNHLPRELLLRHYHVI
mmetsp:Transcript_17050/g.19628  ORF Transcript_17050/g.19628 Transcript_17050/m.19628 type:complete len:259 (+) Transcript_17050:295-1071(+)